MKRGAGGPRPGGGMSARSLVERQAAGDHLRSVLTLTTDERSSPDSDRHTGPSFTARLQHDVLLYIYCHQSMDTDIPGPGKTRGNHHLSRVSRRREITFLARDSIYATARYMPSPVRLSVCLSHGWISQRRLKLGSRNLHHRVAP